MLCPHHRPFESRKVGMPLSALMPAPVRIKTWSDGEIWIMVRLHTINASRGLTGAGTFCLKRYEHTDIRSICPALLKYADPTDGRRSAWLCLRSVIFLPHGSAVQLSHGK